MVNMSSVVVKGNSGVVARPASTAAPKATAQAASQAKSEKPAASKVQASVAAPQKASTQPKAIASAPVQGAAKAAVSTASQPKVTFDRYADPSTYAPFDFYNGYRPQVSNDGLNQWYNRNLERTQGKNYYGPEGLRLEDFQSISSSAYNHDDGDSLDAQLAGRFADNPKSFYFYDKNKDGALNLEEITNSRAFVTTEQGKTVNKTQTDINNLFTQLMNVSNDGQAGISKFDMAKFTRGGFNSGHQTPTASLVNRIFDGIDKDKDGFLNAAEFSNAQFQDGPNIGKRLFNITA